MNGKVIYGIFCVIFLASADGVAASERTGKLIVRLREPKLTQQFVKGLVRSSSSPLKGKALRRSGVVILEDTPNTRNLLRQSWDVAYIEEDIRYKLQETPRLLSGPLSHQNALAPWMKDVLGLEESLQGEIADPAPDDGRMIVAVVDTGGSPSHPYLQDALYINLVEKTGIDGQDDDGNGYVDDVHGANVTSKDGAIDDLANGHGTHVSGLVKSVRDAAAKDYPESLKVVVLPVAFIDANGYGTTASSLVALEYAAAAGAKIINMSWGARGSQAYSRALFDTLASLYERDDIFFAAAAGNADPGLGPTDNDKLSYFPANYNIPSLLSVASLTPNFFDSRNPNGSYRGMKLSSFSNFGRQSVDLAAPGDMVDRLGKGEGVWSANSNWSSEQDLFVRMMGTSMASPVVAGIAGVVRAINPALTSYEVARLIVETSGKNSALSNVAGTRYAVAEKAFAEARVRVSTGAKPGVSPSTPTTTTTTLPPATDPKKPDDSGCSKASVAGPGDGPFGGNGMGLLLAAYAALRLLPALRKKLLASKLL